MMNEKCLSVQLIGMGIIGTGKPHYVRIREHKSPVNIK